MKTAFIIHGTWWSPEGNWFPWMKEKLEAKWYQVFIPRLPTPQGQNLKAWTQEFEKYKKSVSKESIFIAHSSWPAFVLSILESIDMPVQACYFASGFLGLIDIDSFDTLNETITDKDFNWQKIRQSSTYFYMCHGSDDPYVPRFNAEKMAQWLGAEIDIIEWGWHLNKESGYTDFEYLLEKIR